MAARPSVALAEFETLVEDENIERLRSDAAFWTYVEHGSIDAALNRGSFQRIVHDEAMRRRLAALGLVGEDAALDAGAFRSAAAEVLREVGPRIRGLKNDPALQELVEDPQVVAMLHSGDHDGADAPSGIPGPGRSRHFGAASGLTSVSVATGLSTGVS